MVVESDINLVLVVVGSDTNNGRAGESVGTEEEREWKSRTSLGNFVGDS